MAKKHFTLYVFIFAVHLPEECPDTSLTDEIETGGTVSKIAFRIGASIDEVGGIILKTFRMFGYTPASLEWSASCITRKQ